MMQDVTQCLSEVLHSDPDMVKNATVCAAVLRTAGGLSHVLTWLLKEPPPCLLHYQNEEELNPVSCALIRADTAVLFTIVSIMHIEQKKKKKHFKFLKTKKRECLKAVVYLFTLVSVLSVSVYVT